MDTPMSLAPVTDEELKRLREICETAIKSGHFGISVVAQDMLRVVNGFEQLRAKWKKLEEANEG